MKLREIILSEKFKLNKHSCKNNSWIRDFVNGENNFKYMKGGYKEVYTRGEDAITVSTKLEFNKDVVDALQRIDARFQKFLIYPTDWCYIDGVLEHNGMQKEMRFYLTRLNNCPGGDLFDLFKQPYEYERKSADFIKLLLTLNELHKNGIYLGDIKPENIMLCNCDCLAFIDLDDAVLLKKGLYPKEKRYVGTFFFNPIVGNNYDKSRAMMRYADVFAWSVTFLHHLIIKRAVEMAEMNEGDNLFDAFIDSMNKTVRSKGNYDFALLEDLKTAVNNNKWVGTYTQPLKHIYTFLSSYANNLIYNMYSSEWRYTTDWDVETDKLILAILNPILEKTQDLKIKIPKIKF